MVTPRRAGRRRRTVAVVLLAALLLGALWMLAKSRPGSRAPSDRESRLDVPVRPLPPPHPPVPVENNTDEPVREERAAPAGQPALFRGTETITGRVVTMAGDPVRGAEVFCRPRPYQPRYDPEFAALTTRTDRNGAFVFPEFPDSNEYLFCAYTASHYGRAELRGPDRPSEVVIRVKALYYTRYEFVDERGRPVMLNTSLRGLDLGRGTIHSSAWAFSFTHVLRALERMGVEVPQAGNVVTFFFVTPRRPSDPARIGATFPGYQTAQVDTRRRPLAEWPASQRVQLVRASRSRLVLHEMKLPEAMWPAAWGPADHRLRFRIWFKADCNRGMASVARTCSRFVLPPGATIQWIRDQNQVDLPFSLRQSGDKVVVEPQYPDYGFLEVRHAPLPAREWITVTVRRRDTEGAPNIVGLYIVPGVKRFGPLAVGEYSVCLSRLLSGSVSAILVLRELGTCFVHRGTNEFAR